MKPDEFLSTAQQLVRAAAGKPRQADLRRVCSSTYYALFHTLCETCAIMLIGSPDTRRAWTQVYRAVDHQTAKSRCREEKTMTLFPRGIQDFANMLVQMQEKRHRADYDPDEFLYKSEVAADIDAARAAIAAFKRVPPKHRRAFAAYILIKIRQ